MTKNGALLAIINGLYNTFHPDDHKFHDEVLTDLLKILIEKYGTRNLADMITKHPLAGYTYRDLDDFAPKMRAEIHAENIKKTEKELLEMIN